MQHTTHSTECASAQNSQFYKSSGSDSISYNLMKASINARYLDKEEELALVIRWRESQDDDALHEIINSHMRLVISVSNKFKRYNLPLGDLVQEGCIGLLEAATRFALDRGVRFSTYATWWIRASMQDYVLRNWSIVRGGTSSAQKSLFFNLRRLRAKLTSENQELSKEELYKQISKQVGVSVNDVEVLDFRFSAIDNSLSASVSQDEDNTMQKIDMVVDQAPLQDEVVEENIDSYRRKEWLAKALHVLNDRELTIIRTRRLGDENVTLESLGTTLGISKERVRQIEARALQKLRNALLTYKEYSAYTL